MKTKAQKQEILNKLNKDLAKQSALVFADFKGLKVKQIAELRRQLKQKGSKLIVAKKTLFSKAMKEKGIAVDVTGMEGQIAAIFAFEDPFSAIQTAYSFAKANENLKIVGGYFENEARDREYIIAVAQLPSRHELLGRLVGQLAAPMSGFMNVLQGNIKGLVRALHALAQKQAAINN